MKYKDGIKLINKYPHKDHNGKVIAYDSDGKALGEIVWKEGKVISSREYGTEGEGINYN